MEPARTNFNVMGYRGTGRPVPYVLLIVSKENLTIPLLPTLTQNRLHTLNELSSEDGSLVLLENPTLIAVTPGDTVKD